MPVTNALDVFRRGYDVQAANVNTSRDDMNATGKARTQQFARIAEYFAGPRLLCKKPPR